MRPRPPNSTNTTPEIDRLNTLLATALEINRVNPSHINLGRAKALESDLRQKRESFETKTLLQLILRLESLHQVHKMRLFYKKVKENTNPDTNPIFVIHNPDSPPNNPVYARNKHEYLNFWEQYLVKTFRSASDSIGDHMPRLSTSSKSMLQNKKSHCSQSDLDKPLAASEVCLAIKTLKNMKAVGLDEITNEDIKLIEALRPGLIHIVVRKFWESEKCPVEFCQAIFHLIPKPGKPGRSKNLRLQKNYRPIALLSTFRKLYEIILSSRILRHVSLNQAQFGFLSGRSTLDCIFLLVEAILEARYIVHGPRNGTNQRLYGAFLDIKGAFDRVPRILIWQKMDIRFGIRGKLLRVIIDLFTNTTGIAIVNDLISAILGQRRMECVLA